MNPKCSCDLCAALSGPSEAIEAGLKPRQGQPEASGGEDGKELGLTAPGPVVDQQERMAAPLVKGISFKKQTVQVKASANLIR